MHIAKEITGYDPIISSFPIEFREYYAGSEGMEWHLDTQLYENPYQIEAVITLNNNSDSYFEWTSSSDEEIRGIKPKPSSLLLISTEKPTHRVTPLNKGERQILKIVIPFNGSRKTKAYFKEITNLQNLG